ncbi:AMP-binding protein [Longispora albida]|uniref:AMP-binding protein n=1 Tax=Longispora albida TaxID=203523 RepID=UPI000378FF6C|nr:AMP-binding protein [Longispora albida]
MDNVAVPAGNYVSKVLELFAGYGDAEAIVAGERRFTYNDVRTGILTMAAALYNHGLRPGVSVGILAGSAPETVALQFGVHLMGGRVAWIAPNSPVSFRREFLALSGVDAFVYDADSYPEAGAELAATGDLPVFCIGADGLGPDLKAAPVVTELPFDLADVTTEPQALFQTGGTTGQPKLVHHKQRFFETVLAFGERYLATGGHHMRHLALSGYWHVSAQMPAHMSLFTGGTYIIQDGFDVEEFYDLIASERITDTLIPPPLLGYLLDNPATEKADLSSLRWVSLGGSPTAPARMSQAIARMGTVLRPAYGMSEAPIIAAYPQIPDDPALLSSVGQPYGDLQLEIRDPDGNVLPIGETGEICVSGGVMMAGYWGLPELTAETLVDGWLRTGDVGYLDEAGNLFLVDRLKDMILTGWGSTNVYARPIENVLAAIPGVAAAAVIGVPHATWGEAVHACVVLSPGVTMTEDEVKAAVSAELNDLWAPRTVEFLEALPLTEANKVNKLELRARYLASTS